MAVGYDNSSFQQSASFPGSPSNYTFVPGGTATVLYVWLHWAVNAAPDSVSMTWNGVAMNFIADYNSGSGPRGALFRLVSPATGSHTLAVTHSGLTHSVGILSLTGTDTSTPEGTISSNTGIAAATSDTLAPASAVGDLIVRCITLNGGTALAATGTGSTLRVNGNTADADGPGGVATQDAVAGTTSGGFSWTTNATGVAIGFAAKAAAGGGGSAVPKMMLHNHGG